MENIPLATALFIAGIGPIVIEAQASRQLYSRALGIPFKEEKGGYLHTESLKGANTFACGRSLRPLSHASARIRGVLTYPFRKPGLSLMSTTSKQLRQNLNHEYQMLVRNRKEP